MEAYIDYTYYKDVYRGNAMPKDECTRVAQKASAYLRYITMNRITQPVPEEVRDACCEIAENIYAAAKTAALSEKSNGVKSENNDGHSVTFLTPGELNTAYRNTEKKNRDAARMYLANTGLLYRGIR